MNAAALTQRIAEASPRFKGSRREYIQGPVSYTCAILSQMLTPEQQNEYTRLSTQLQSIGQRYFKELPHGSVSLVLTVNQGNLLVEAYDRMGRKLGEIPNQWTSSEFRSDLEQAFAQVTLPDENITTIVSNPMRLSANS